MLGAVLNFILARRFVFFNQSGFVFVERAAGDDAGLRLTLPVREAINIERRLFVAR